MVGAVLSLGCASLLGVEDYKDSAGELCDLLEACYDFGQCQQHIGPPLDSAPASVRTLWLASLSDKGCLEQCSSARRCLNMAPVCFGLTAPCTRIEECCGFLTGEAGCAAPVGGGPERCCKADGASCVADDECCSIQGCDERTNTCGGEVCKAVGQLCTGDVNCCTGLCGDDQRCAENICTTEGFGCVTTEECCTGLSCLDGRCGVGPTCRAEGEKCYVTPEVPSQGCCEGTCVPTHVEGQDQVGLCSVQGCLPESANCELAGSECCPGFACDKFKQQCAKPCKGQGETCAQGYECCSGSCPNGTCECSQGACVEDTDCCVTTGSAGVCIAGACSPMCATKQCHDICLVGPPMDSAACGNTNPAKNTVLNSICASDKYCCCVKWDDLCTEEAAKLAGACM